MPNDLISTDPIVARNFTLDFDGESILLSGVSGLDQELSVVSTTQVGKGGKQQMIKTLGSQLTVPDISVTRMAPVAAMDDPIWKWFHEVRDHQFKATSRTAGRKNGSVVFFDTAYTEVGRFNFFNGWISKISTDGLTVESNDAVKETITLTIERLERVK